MSENDALDFVKKWLTKSNYENYTINIESIGKKGDNYLGVIYYISVITENKFAEKEKFDIVVKAAFTEGKLREFASVKETYAREIYLYTEVFPALQKFQNDLNLKNPFTSVPKCFSTSTEENREFLILENLKKQGFQILDRKVPMNDQHITFVLKELGKFHGISFALRAKDYTTFKKLSDKLDNVIVSFNDKFKNAMGLCTEKCLDILAESGELKARDKLEAVKTDVGVLFTELSECKDENYSVIAHADCWCNNMMFKYDVTMKMLRACSRKGEGQKFLSPNDSKPIAMRFLDFQLSRMAHPVLDLSYFFYTACNKETLDNFENYLKIYHDSFSSYLIEVGCDPQELLPLKKLRDHWNYYSRFGMYVSFMLTRWMHMDADEAPELMDDAMVRSVESVIREEEKYRSRVTDVIVHCAERGVI